MSEQTPAASYEATREQLLARWRDARRKRDSAELGGDAWREAAEEIGRIEVEIARIDRAMNRV